MPLTDLGQQAPPPGGYSVARFEGYIDAMERKLQALLDARDFRAVFQLTYLTFSKQVLAALKAGRFQDSVWATDMCCRFVEVYLHQQEMWARRDPEQCRAWRVAFQSSEDGSANVMQAMLLGMNAHINYDLAFVTLGACQYAGDLPTGDTSERALSGTRGGVPVVRYSDFLVINQVGWESLPLIQDTVLSTFNRFLYWGNRITRSQTMAMGERVLMDARDASWFQTCLLVHAQPGEERGRVARVIDAYAASVADVIGALTLKPAKIIESVVAWQRRSERLDPEIQAGLVDMARRNPVVAELALQQLAFAGADPVSVIESLLRSDDAILAGTFGNLAFRQSPAVQRQRLQTYLASHSERSLAALEAILETGEPSVAARKDLPVDRVQDRWFEQAQESRRCLAAPAIAEHTALREAIGSYVVSVQDKLDQVAAAGFWPRRDQLVPLTSDELHRVLATHPDPWVRLCAQQAFGSNGDTMSETIERVLFLKETQVFMEVDPAVLVHVAEHLDLQLYAPGTLIVRSGTQSGGIRFIRSGEVEVSQTRDGATVRIAKLARRDSVGEISALNDTPTTADCTALTSVECFFLPSRVLAQLMHHHPRLAIGLIRMLSQRLMATTLQVHGQKSAAA